MNVLLNSSLCISDAHFHIDWLDLSLEFQHTMYISENNQSSTSLADPYPVVSMDTKVYSFYWTSFGSHPNPCCDLSWCSSVIIIAIQLVDDVYLYQLIVFVNWCFFLINDDYLYTRCILDWTCFWTWRCKSGWKYYISPPLFLIITFILK